jgi:hypothetical protein
MINASSIVLYYPNSLGSADGQALTTFNLAAGSTTKLLNSDATQANDYWNDALVLGLTGTNLENQWNHVKAYSNTSGAVTLATALPGTPTMPGTFHLIHMGKNSAYRSSYEIPGLTATTPTNVTGVTIDYASFTNEVGSGTLTYTNSTKTLQWTAPSDVIGGGVSVTGDGVQTLFSADDSKYIKIDVTYLSLPGTNQSDTIALTQPVARVIPNTEAFQSETGIVRYIAVFFKNESLADSMNELKSWVDPRVTASTTSTTTLATTAAILGVTDASSYPARSFWIYNSTLDDCRYVKYRSGNNLYCAAAGAGLRGKTSTSWAIGNTVVVWTDVDVTLPTLTSNHLPADITALTYTSPMTYDTGLDFGTFTAGSLGAVIMRETILDVVYPVDSVISKLKFKFW